MGKTVIYFSRCSATVALFCPTSFPEDSDMLSSSNFTRQAFALALGLFLGCGATVQSVWAADDGMMLRGRAIKEGMLGRPQDGGGAGGP